ncbi:uncharacterized protein SOCEGT47_037370 [Sorangium cellulosum]|uniref:Bacteriophage T5 Orf172 DNA-binding domain-containing protein n=1 Tax=Sorangium cellulosum TaxID=56 RepID=A0A4P2Q1U6_SORCE|nr:GIY-YIG nuclease family protein [Sorangium cellulosum]AUX23214.1 uncharacterized protein SOCEGT47_037370 [Sorangium cellulosum]
MEELSGALLGVALLAIAVLVGWVVKLRAERAKLHGVREAAERMKADLERFRGVLDVEAERQRVLAQLETDRARLQGEITQARTHGEQAQQRLQAQLQQGTAELVSLQADIEFDVHAMIYSEDAPALETALHRAFHERRINLVNEKKEFFQVEIDEIATAVRRMHGEIEITRAAEAEQYRKTVAMRREREAAQQASAPVRLAPQPAAAPAPA